MDLQSLEQERKSSMLFPPVSSGMTTKCWPAKMDWRNTSACSMSPSLAPSTYQWIGLPDYKELHMASFNWLFSGLPAAGCSHAKLRRDAPERGAVVQIHQLRFHRSRRGSPWRAPCQQRWKAGFPSEHQPAPSKSRSPKRASHPSLRSPSEPTAELQSSRFNKRCPKSSQIPTPSMVLIVAPTSATASIRSSRTWTSHGRRASKLSSKTKLKKYRLHKDRHGKDDVDQRRDVVSQMVRAVISHSHLDHRLDQITMAQRKSEMEFYFRLHSISAVLLCDIFKDHGGEDWLVEYGERLRGLDFKTTKGFMNGLDRLGLRK